MAKKDYYDVLGINKGSTPDDIKKSYRKLAKKYHPDVSTETNAESKFKEVQEAYDILSDTTKKAQYDQFGHAAFDQAGGFGQGGFNQGDFDFGDIFSAFFGGGGRSQRATNRPLKGSDIRRRMTVSFEESIFGKKEKIKIPVYDECHVCHGLGAKSKSDIKACSRCHGSGSVVVESQTLFGRTQTRRACPTCHGTGKEIIRKCSNCNGEGVEKIMKEVEIRVPEGIETGQQIRLENFGNKGSNSGPNGDLYIVFEVRRSETFIRHGDDIIIHIPLTFAQAALGTEIQVPTVYGKVLLKVPSGTQSDSKFRLKGKGAPNIRSKVKGDEHVIVTVVTPSKLSGEQKKIFVQLLKVEDKPEKNNKSFWSKLKKTFK